MKTLRAVWRLLRFLAALAWYATPLWIRAARGPIDWHHHQAVRQRFCQAAMGILGVELEWEGAPYREGACVYASNHRSWLDPFAQMAVLWAFPVAKADVAKLPIVAHGARATGILFVDRGDRKSRGAVIEQMVAAIREGNSILIYPEGTTSADAGTIAFHRGAFLVTEQAGCPLVPLTIAYADPELYWAEGESLWANFVDIAGRRRTRVRLHIGEPRRVADAAVAMGETRAAIDAEIERLARATLPQPAA